jgi:hypothetical protein
VAATRVRYQLVTFTTFAASPLYSKPSHLGGNHDPILTCWLLGLLRSVATLATIIKSVTVEYSKKILAALFSVSRIQIKLLRACYRLMGYGIRPYIPAGSPRFTAHLSTTLFPPRILRQALFWIAHDIGFPRQVESSESIGFEGLQHLRLLLVSVYTERAVYSAVSVYV